MKRATLLLLLTTVLFVGLYPCDGLISRTLTSLPLAGDVRRTLETLQQFGDLGTLVLTGVIIWLLDPPRRVFLWDMILAALVNVGASNLLKLGIGRPRPPLHDPATFIWPWRTYPLASRVNGQEVLRHVHAWAGGSPLWSMPSSHTSAAVVLGLFLVHLYPKLKPVGITLVALVALARIVLNAHYPTDVLVGAAVGYLCGYFIITGHIGQRLVVRKK